MHITGIYCYSYIYTYNSSFIRECIRDTEKHPFGKQIELRRKADHFVFSVESSGCLPPVDVVRKVRRGCMRVCILYV